MIIITGCSGEKSHYVKTPSLPDDQFSSLGDRLSKDPENDVLSPFPSLPASPIIYESLVGIRVISFMILWSNIGYHIHRHTDPHDHKSNHGKAPIVQKAA